MHRRYAAGGAHPHIPDSLPHIAPASGSRLAPGAYRGFVVTYDWSGKMEYSLRSIVVDAAGGRLRGRLNLYSPKLKEPARPMYFELLKI